MSAPLLSIRGLTKRFARNPALESVDLDVEDGQIVALLGPTGAGKTTLLRCIAGLEEPEAGSITMGGRDALALPPAAASSGGTSPAGASATAASSCGDRP